MYVVEILPGIWLGDEASAFDQEFISLKNIECIINCSVDIGFLDNDMIKKKIRLSIRDNLTADEIHKMYTHLHQTVDFIHEQIKNHNILIHCKVGIQRSATVIVAYLIKYADMQLKEAINAVKTKKPDIFRKGCNFEPALELYTRTIRLG